MIDETVIYQLIEEIKSLKKEMTKLQEELGSLGEDVRALTHKISLQS